MKVFGPWTDFEILYSLLLFLYISKAYFDSAFKTPSNISATYKILGDFRFLFSEAEKHPVVYRELSLDSRFSRLKTKTMPRPNLRSGVFFFFFWLLWLEREKKITPDTFI